MLGAILLNIPTIINGCFLVNPDTGSYIAHQFLSRFNESRSKFYSIFLLLTNFKISLLFSVLAQGLIASYCIWLYCRFVFLFRRPMQKTWLTALLLGLLSALPWYVSQINPDVFTGLMVLFVGLYFFEEAIPNPHRRWLRFFLLLCIAVHGSNLLLALGLAIVFVLLGIFFSKIFFKVAKFLAGAAVGVAFVLSLGNFIYFGSFSPNPSSHVFLLSRLAEMGILGKYLDKNCPEKSWKLCASKEKIKGRQWLFMWDEENFPHATLGWNHPEVKREYRQILFDIFSNKSLRSQALDRYLHDFLLQSTFYKIDDGLHEMVNGSSPHLAIQQYYPHTDLYFFERASQQNKSLPFLFFSKVHSATLLLSVALLLFALLYEQANPKMVLIFCFLVLFLLMLWGNNFITSVLSTYMARFQSRMIWILPFWAIISVFVLLEKKNRV